MRERLEGMIAKKELEKSFLRLEMLVSVTPSPRLYIWIGHAVYR